MHRGCFAAHKQDALVNIHEDPIKSTRAMLYAVGFDRNVSYGLLPCLTFCNAKFISAVASILTVIGHPDKITALNL